ncbi:Transposable element P transposase [Frankliniella fusca]|uniref:Transposable element P transposase n=1 Tax=Frankliniella fusca TaxID=407009 RepID=A0AAE1L9U9_9NEOP|nr:Transposable element P transposase [Frankliniella fusca]
MEEGSSKDHVPEKRTYRKRKNQVGIRSRSKKKANQPSTSETKSEAQKDPKRQSRKRRKSEVGQRAKVVKKRSEDLQSSRDLNESALSGLSTEAIISGTLASGSQLVTGAGSSCALEENISGFSTEGIIGGVPASCSESIVQIKALKGNDDDGSSTILESGGDSSSDSESLEPNKGHEGNDRFSTTLEMGGDSSSDSESLEPNKGHEGNDECSTTIEIGDSFSDDEKVQGIANERISYELNADEYASVFKEADSDDEAENCSNTGLLDFLDQPEFSTSTSSSQGNELSEHPPTATAQIKDIALELSILLSDSPWIMNTTADMCRLSLLSPFPNAVVERGICWSNSQAEVYIHNRPLPVNSFLWGKETPVPSEAADVAKYLWRLSFVLNGTHICPGIEDFKDYWPTAASVGYVQSEVYTGKECFRTFTCAMAVTRSGRCESCYEQKEIFRKRLWKLVNVKGKDEKKITNKNLSKEKLMEKASKLQVLSKKQQLQIQKLKEKVKKMIEQDSVQIDQHLGADFMKVLRNNASKMTDVQKLFWTEQLKALARQSSPTGMIWNPMMIRIALHMQNISPAALNYMKDAGFIILPCNGTLYDFTHFVDNSEGIQHEILDLIEKKIEELQIPANEKYFNLVFDEIHIKSDLVRNKHGELIGYLNLNQVETALSELENSMINDAPRKQELAKKVLAYMLQGINYNIHEVVGLFSTTDVTAVQIFSRTWNLIYHLESRCMKIISLVCDGAASNKKEMWKNNQTLSWKALEKLQEVDVENKFKLHKLTKAHVYLTAFTRMRVSLATQVCSQSVADSLKKYVNDTRFQGLISCELITFLEKCNRMFDCLNGTDDPEGVRNKMNLDLLPYTECLDERFDFLESILTYFQDWQRQVLSREGNMSLEQRRRMQISKESYDSLHITISGFCGAVRYLLKNTGIKSIKAKDLNQDKLEQEFGLFRMSFGSNNHPTLQNLIQKVLSNYVQRSAALPVDGNIKGKRKILSVDESLLPRRPRQ